MSNDNQLNIRKFASANGFSGFRSYFPQIYSPQMHKRVFILKGGPGTGKSTLMKKIYDKGIEWGAAGELFYCSSDTRSLDGVILQNGENSVAVIDGTAPHITDPILPGARDEIVDLGIAFDTNGLTGAYDELLKLNEKKISAYSKAYEYLSQSAVFDSKIKAEIKLNFDYASAISYINNLIDGAFTTESGTRSIRLVSSFSSDGYEMFGKKNTFPSDVQIRSKGVYCALADRILTVRGIRHTAYVNALDGELCDAIDCPSIGIYLNKLISCSDTVPSFLPHGSEEKIMAEYAWEYETLNSLLCKAAEQLDCARNYHVNIEGIYGRYVDFERIDQIGNSLCERINFYLYG